MRLLLVLLALQAVIVLASTTEEDTLHPIMERRDEVDEEAGLTLEDEGELVIETERQRRRCYLPCYAGGAGCVFPRACWGCGVRMSPGMPSPVSS